MKNCHDRTAAAAAAVAVKAIDAIPNTAAWATHKNLQKTVAGDGNEGEVVAPATVSHTSGCLPRGFTPWAVSKRTGFVVAIG